MNKQIILSIDKKKELATMFGFSRQTIWAALHFRTNSRKANMIRAAALQRGGILIGGTKCVNGITPNVTTEFNTSEKLMVQTFTERVKLVADLASGLVNVYADGEVVDSYPDPCISQLLVIQKKVQHIANQLQ